IFKCSGLIGNINREHNATDSINNRAWSANRHLGNLRIDRTDPFRTISRARLYPFERELTGDSLFDFNRDSIGRHFAVPNAVWSVYQHRNRIRARSRDMFDIQVCAHITRPGWSNDRLRAGDRNTGGWKRTDDLE